MNIKNQLLRLTKFGLVGGLNTLLSIVIFYVCLELYEFPLYPTYITVYALLTALSYYMNAKFTFESKRNRKDFSRYFVIYGMGLTIGLLSLVILERIFSFRPFYLVLLVIPLRVLLTYILINKVIYTKPEASSD